ncbi:MAG: hypothetical protein J6J00_12280 [Treponema sp.]|nr:hypothetical protein [Treponema sp.]
MNKMTTKHTYVLNFLISAFAALFFTTCEIGLGAAVDTEAPLINITVPNPDVVSVIRDSFPIMGSWSDDGTISSVEVTLTSTSNGVNYKTEAQVTTNENAIGQGSWKCIISPTENAILDGDYSVSVKITDSAGHNTSQNSQIRIDNTAPLVVLQRPSSILDSSSFDTFGQTLSLVGQTTDDNSVILMKMSVYSDKNFKTSKEEPVEIEFTKISDTINLDIAKFEANVQNYYADIYKSTTDVGVRSSYFTLVAYDGAQRYEEDGTQTADDTLGNKSSVYYLYNDIADLISAYKITGLYDMLAGTYQQDTSRQATASSVLTLLSDSKVEVGSFNLNPKNNPTYSMTGFSNLHLPSSESKSEYESFFNSKTGGEYTNGLTKGKSFQFEVSPGLDEVPLVGDSLKIYACTVSLVGDSPVYGSKTLLESKQRKSGSKYILESSVPETFEPGNNYKIWVEGQDENNVVIVPDGTDYAFRCTVIGTGPTVNYSISKNNSPYDSKTVIANDLDTVNISGSVTYEQEGSLEIILDNDTENPVYSDNSAGTEHSFDYPVPLSKFDQFHTSSHTIQIVAEADGITRTSTIKVTYDVEAPTASLGAPSPIAKKYSSETYNAASDGINYLNGTITLKVNISDENGGSGIDSETSKLQYSENQTNWTDLVFENTTYAGKNELYRGINVLSVDTTKIASNSAGDKNVYFRVKALDAAGNESSSTLVGSYTVSQESDNPVILPGKDWMHFYDSADAEFDKDTYAKTLLQLKKVYFTIIDDDDSGLASVEVLTSDGAIAGEIKDFTAGNKTSTCYFTSDVFEYAGVYKITIKATDKNGNSSIKSTYVYISASAPKISDVKITDNKYVTTNTENITDEAKKTMNVSLKINSNQTPLKLTYKITDSAGIEKVRYNEAQETYNSEQDSYSFTLTPPADLATGKYNLSVKVYDNNNAEGEQNIPAEFYVDNARPEVGSVRVPGADGKETESSSFDFDITASDDGGSSTVPSVYKIKFGVCDDANGTNPTNETDEVDATSTKSYSLKFADYAGEGNTFGASGYKYAKAYVIDAVGNKSNDKIVVFPYDTGDPIAEITAYKANGESSSQNIDDNSFNIGKQFTLSGSASDDWQLAVSDALVLTEVKTVTDGNGNKTTTSQDIKTGFTFASSTGNWSYGLLPKDGLETAKYTYTLTVKDKIGKTFTTAPVTVEIDQTAPALVFVEPNSNILSGLTAFTGNVTDVGLGVDYLSHAIVKDGDSPNYNRTALTGGSSANFRLAIETKAGTGEAGKEISYSETDNKYTIYEGKYKLYLKVYDKAGNTSTETIYDFYVDQAKPNIKDIKLGDWDLVDSGTNYVKVTDDNINITGSVEESYGIENGNITVTVGDTTYNDVTVTNSGSVYSFTTSISKPAENEEVSIIISATDKANRESSVTYKVYNDTTDPVIEFTSPDIDLSGEDSLSGSSYKFVASNNDDGSGIVSLKSYFVQSDNEPLPDDIKNNSTAESITAGNSISWTVTKELIEGTSAETGKLHEGKWYVCLYAVDAVGNEKIAKRFVWIDKNDPSLTCSEIEATGQVVNNVPVRNAGFTLSGTTSDNNGIKSLVIMDGDTEVKKYEASDSPAVVVPSDWSQAFALTEGTHTLTITATDKAERKTVITKKVIIDTVSPSGSLEVTATAKYTDSTDQTKKWYNSQNINIKVTPSDATSGIYQVLATADDPSSDAAAWTLLTPNAGKTEYSGSVYCGAQGENTIRVKIVDNAGNDNTDLIAKVYIDTEMPDTETGAIISVDGSTEADKISGQKLVNGRNSVTIVMTIKDKYNENDSSTASGIKSVKYIKPLTGETSITADPVSGESDQWKVTIKKENLDTGTVVFEIEDNVGKKTTYTTDLSIFLDNAAPMVKKITKPDYVNGNISLSGTVTDARAVATVDVSYYVDYTGYKTWTPIYHGTSENWETSLDVAALSDAGVPDGTEIYIVPVVLDTAGNCNLDTVSEGIVIENHEEKPDGTGDDAITYMVPKKTVTPSAITANNEGNIVKLILNQDSDRPVITLDGISFAEMTSENPYKSSSNIISGIVEDDDGLAGLKLYYNLDAEKESESSSELKWNDVTLNNSSFTITGIPDDSHTLLFKVSDKGGTDFVTSADASLCLAGPKVTDGTNRLAYTSAESSAIYIKVDVTAPSIDGVKYKRKASAEYVDYSKETLETFGGNETNRMLYLQVAASDSNGIESIKVSLEKDVEDKDSDGNSLADSVYTRTLKLTADPSDKTKFTGITEIAFDVSNMVSGKRNIIVIADDGIQSTTNTYSIVIDNEAPELEVTSHSNEQLILKGFLLRGGLKGGDESTSIKYLITKDSARPDSWADAVSVSNVSAYSWQLYFDRASNNISVDESTGYTHDSNPKYLVTRFTSTVEINSDGAVVYKAGQTNAGQRYTEKENYYFHFLVTDSYGNEAYKDDFCLKIDPNGDTPLVSLSNPQKETYGWWKEEDGVINWYQKSENEWGGESSTTAPANTTGYTYAGPAALSSGIIRVSGTASAENGLKAVYIQIDPSYDPSVGFAENWQEKALPKEIGSLSENASSLGYNSIETIGNSGRSGIKIGSSQTWNISLNGKSEFEKANASNIIAIRLFALDVNNNVSASDDDIFLIRVDSGAPRIGSSERLMLRQYDSSGNVTAVKEYTENMWLNGKWYLEGSVEDDSGISAITIGTNNLIGTNSATAATWNEGGTKGYRIKYLIGNNTLDAVGSDSFTINVTDKDSNPSRRTISYRYDNKAPVLESPGGANYNISTSVKNSDGFYTVQSGASEGRNESGFKMAVFYFKREITGIQKIYDSYIKKDSVGNALSYSGTSAELVKGEEGLWWRKDTIASGGISGANVTLENANPNIHAGGLAKIAGVIYRIENYDVSNKLITLDGSPDESLVDEPEEKCDIYFVIGHVVDKEGSESSGSRSNIITLTDRPDGQLYGYYKNDYDGVTSDDDGDHMIETLATTDTVTRWAGSINSNNIPDGPIEIHYVVFDKAGNYDSGSVTSAKVQNNAPRLAGLKVKSGADENVFYYGGLPRVVGGKSVTKATGLADSENKLVVSGNKKAKSDGGTAFMTVKDAIEFTPEIVGGNGALYYSYYVEGASGQTSIASESAPSKGTASFGDGNNDGIDDYADAAGSSNAGYYLKDIEGSEYYEGHSVGPITFTVDQVQSLAANSSAAAPTWFHYTIWDSTDGTVVNSGEVSTWNSLNVSFDCALNVQYFDIEKPSAEILPLYWNSSSDNSLYLNSRDNGHIELMNDLPDDHVLKQAPYGTGDKVSGKITMKGTASDNIHVSSIWVKIDGLFSDYVSVAHYDNGNWICDNNMETSGIACNVTDITDSSDADVAKGYHKVKWEISIDTEIIGVAKDVEFSVRVDDEASSRGQNSDNSSTPQSYTMDVVPYITRVTTSLSSIESSNPSVFDRTALGHYPVYVIGKDKTISGGESVIITGFNLGTNTSVNASSLVTSADSASKSTSAKYSISISGKDYSKVSPSNTDVTFESINNLNNNDADGSYENEISNESAYSVKKNYAYNRLPNNDNNNNLTDDVVFDVWQFNSVAAIPNGGKIEQAVMKINPVNDLIGFAFVNGSFWASMPMGTNSRKNAVNSYQTWMKSRDFCTSTTFVYDKNGYTYGGIAGGDSGDMADKFNFVTSRWGVSSDSNAQSTRNGTNALRLEELCDNTYSNKAFEKQRIMSPSYATAVHDDITNIYLAYYDSLYSQIRFKAGSINQEHILPINYYDVNWNGYTYGHITFDGTLTTGMKFTFCDAQGNEVGADVYSKIAWGESATYYTSGNVNHNGTDWYFTLSKTKDGPCLDTTQTNSDNPDRKNFWNGEYTSNDGDTIRYPDTQLYVKFNYNSATKDNFGNFVDACDSTNGWESYTEARQYVQVLASSGTQNYKYKINNVEKTETTYTTGNAGSYVSLGVVSTQEGTVDDVVVATWYDSTNRILWYSYNTTPTENRAGSSRDDSSMDDGWSTPIRVFEDGSEEEHAGEYCKLAVDAKGGVHVAAFDSASNTVVYAYLDSLNKGIATRQSDFSTCLVDGNAPSGEYLTLDVALADSSATVATPYIGYYSQGCIRPKMAYAISPTKTAKDGTTDSFMTGKWEITVVPTAKSVEIQSNQHNPINVGVWKDTSGILKTSIATGTSSSATDKGTCYGNGTSNPVLGYVITDDTIETAQKK